MSFMFGGAGNVNSLGSALDNTLKELFERLCSKDGSLDEAQQSERRASSVSQTQNVWSQQLSLSHGKN